MRLKKKKLKTKRERKPSRKQLVKQLDCLVSQIVRQRDNHRCVICGSTTRPQAGHLHSRKHYSTRWDTKNIFCQCAGCNLKHCWDMFPFYEWHIKTFGMKEFLRIRKKWEEQVVYSNDDLMKLLRQLQEEHGTNV